MIVLLNQMNISLQNNNGKMLFYYTNITESFTKKLQSFANVLKLVIKR